MINNVSVQYNGGFLPDMILLTTIGGPIKCHEEVSSFFTAYDPGCSSCLSSLCFTWYPCIAINVSVQYNGGFRPDVILLTTIGGPD